METNEEAIADLYEACYKNLDGKKSTVIFIVDFKTPYDQRYAVFNVIAYDTPQARAECHRYHQKLSDAHEDYVSRIPTHQKRS